MSVSKAGRKVVTVYNKEKAYNGYTLYSPHGSKDTWLIDMEGRFVHQWRMPLVPGSHGILLENGNLLYAGKLKDIDQLPYGWTREFSAIGGYLLEMDWDGKILWEKETPCQAHDFTLMDNGHIMYFAWHPKGVLPPEKAAKVKGGSHGSELKGSEIWGDILVEIDRGGKVVWEWIAYEHLDPEIDIICPYESRSQWPYINSVKICSDGNVLCSFRYCSEIAKIDYKTGKILARYGRGRLSHQHDARELPNGNITCFDNGSHRHEYQPEYSRAVEIDPKADEIVWQYKANPPSDFYSPHSSGVERQPNGNTLINETTQGRIFEVTRDGEIVWEYVNPRYIPYHGRFCNEIWRAHRYPMDYPGLKRKDLDPDRLKWVNRIWGPDGYPGDIRPCIF